MPSSTFNAFTSNSFNLHNNPMSQAGIMSSISQMRTLQHREVKEPTQGHTASNQQSWDGIPCSWVPEFMSLTVSPSASQSLTGAVPSSCFYINKKRAGRTFNLNIYIKVLGSTNHQTPRERTLHTLYQESRLLDWSRCQM